MLGCLLATFLGLIDGSCGFILPFLNLQSNQTDPIARRVGHTPLNLSMIHSELQGKPCYGSFAYRARPMARMVTLTSTSTYIQVTCIGFIPFGPVMIFPCPDTPSLIRLTMILAECTSLNTAQLFSATDSSSSIDSFFSI